MTVAKGKLEKDKAICEKATSVKAEHEAKKVTKKIEKKAEKVA